MPITTTTRTLFDGLAKVAQQFTGYSDDGTGETNVVKVDASDLTPPATNLKVLRVTYDVQGGAVALSWDGLADVNFLVCSGQGEFCYDQVGGLQSDADYPTQDILLTTKNFEPGSSYALTLEMRKL